MTAAQQAEIDRLQKIARNLTVFADDFHARARSFYDRADEYLAQAAALQAEAKATTR